MTEDEAFAAVGMLTGVIRVMTDELIDAFVQSFIKMDNGPAMIETCSQLAATWKGENRPSIGDVQDAYRRHPDVARAREDAVIAANLRRADAPGGWCGGTGWVETAPGSGDFKPCPRCNPYLSDVYADEAKWKRYRDGAALEDLLTTVTRGRDGLKGEIPMPTPCQRDARYDPDHVVSAAEGRAIMATAFRDRWGRDIGAKPVPNPQYAITAIQALDRFDAKREVWLGSFGEVLAAFNDDYPRAAASLKAIGSRLTHDSQGHLTLKATDDRLEAPPVVVKGPGAVETALVPSAATQPVEDDDFREAIRQTTERILGERDD